MLKANGVNSSKLAAAKSDAGDDKTPTTPVKRKPAGASGGSAKKKAKATKKEESDDDVKDPKLVSKPAKGVKREPKKEPKKEPKEEYESPLSGKLIFFHSCFTASLLYPTNIFKCRCSRL